MNLDRQTVLKNLNSVFSRKGRGKQPLVYEAECAEEITTLCSKFIRVSIGVEVEEMYPAAVIAYREGWRCFKVPGYECFACPSCLEYNQAIYGEMLTTEECEL